MTHDLFHYRIGFECTYLNSIGIQCAAPAREKDEIFQTPKKSIDKWCLRGKGRRGKCDSRARKKKDANARKRKDRKARRSRYVLARKRHRSGYGELTWCRRRLCFYFGEIISLSSHSLLAFSLQPAYHQRVPRLSPLVLILTILSLLLLLSFSLSPLPFSFFLSLPVSLSLPPHLGCTAPMNDESVSRPRLNCTINCTLRAWYATVSSAIGRPWPRYRFLETMFDISRECYLLIYHAPLKSGRPPHLISLVTHSGKLSLLIGVITSECVIRKPN